MPGTGFPLVISSTMCAKEVGYGAGGSLGLVGVGMIPLGSDAGAEVGVGVEVEVGSGMTSSTMEEARTFVELGGVGGGRLRAER